MVFNLLGALNPKPQVLQAWVCHGMRALLLGSQEQTLNPEPVSYVCSALRSPKFSKLRRVDRDATVASGVLGFGLWGVSGFRV